MADLFSGVSAQSAPSVFNFGAHAVRIVVRDGEPWFVAADVAAALGYRDAQDAGRSLKPEQKGTQNVRTPGGEQRVTIINESGLYRLVLRSRKPEAEKFSDWVTGEVLPSIRKTGGYAKPTADTERLKQAYELAAEVAAVAARTVFDAVISGDAVSLQDRWMFCMGHPNRNGVAEPWAKPIQGDAMVVSLKDLPRRLLEPNGMLPSNKELADLAAACNQRLARRMEYEARKAVTP